MNKEKTLIKMRYFNNEKYSDTINRIKRTSLLHQSRVSRYMDNSISIGLCGEHMASVSMVLKCPFDTRKDESEFKDTIYKELNLSDEHDKALLEISKNGTISVFNECQNYCLFKIYEKQTNKKAFLEKNYITDECYNEVVIPVIKNLILKI